MKSKNPNTQAAKISSDQDYSYPAQLCLQSPKHKPEDNGVFIECTHHQHGFDPHDVHGSAFPNSQPQNKTYDDVTAVQDHTYCNILQNYEVPENTTVSDLDRPLQVATGLKKSVSSPVLQSKSAAAAAGPLYTGLIGREVHYQDYDKLSPAHTSHKRHQSSPPKPRIARQPKQIISNNTSRMDYENISMWLSSKKKPPPQAAESVTLPSGYTRLLRSTMTKKSDYDNTFRQELPTAVIVRTHTLV